MSRKGPKVGQGMLDFVEDYCVGVKSHQISFIIPANLISLIFEHKIGVHIRLNSWLEVGDDASNIVNFGYLITGDYCIRRYSRAKL